MLSTPPAFILSQDQTLNKNFVFVFAVFVECTCKHARSPHYSRKLILIQFKINILANLSLLLFYKVSSLNACFRKTKFSGRYSSFLESFKVVSLFNYQGSLLLFSSAATFISYHCFLSLSTTFYLFFDLSIEALCFLLSLSDSFIIISSVPAFVNSFFHFFTKFPFFLYLCHLQS